MMSPASRVPERPPPAADAATPDLVRAAQHGDRDAFGMLYERYARMVHGLLLAHGTDDDAADLLQDVFLRALARLDQLRDPSSFGGWLAGIARNAARMRHRSGLRLVPLTDEMTDRIAAPSAEPAELDGATVLAAVRSLPDAYRETLVLRLVEGMPGAEIAARLGMTHGSVRVNLHRGFALLRQRLTGREASTEE